MFKLIVGIAALVIIGTFAPWIFIVAGVLLAIFLAWWGINAATIAVIEAFSPAPTETPRIPPEPAGPHTRSDFVPLVVVGVIVLGYVALIAGGA